MKKVRVGSSVGFACTLLVASPVLAQKTDGAVRLSMDGVVFAGEFGTLVPPSDPVLGSVEIDTTTTNAGLYAGSRALPSAGMQLQAAGGHFCFLKG